VLGKRYLVGGFGAHAELCRSNATARHQNNPLHSVSP
jgi:hypothetical protein